MEADVSRRKPDIKIERLATTLRGKFGVDIARTPRRRGQPGSNDDLTFSPAFGTSKTTVARGSDGRFPTHEEKAVLTTVADISEGEVVGRVSGGTVDGLSGATLEGITRTALAASTGAINVNGQNIENVGVIKFADSQYADYLVGGFQLGSGASAPTMRVYRDSIQFPAFAGTGPLEEGFFEIHILHDIKAGSTPTFHVHWSHIVAAPSGNVKWNISLTACKGYRVGAFPAAATLSTVSAATTQYEHVITSDDDMPLPPALVAILEPDMKIIGRIYRDPADVADTFANDAYFLGLDLHYQVGQSGTSERNRPFISAGFGK